MEMNNAIKTKQLGQSIWYDNIDREDLENGKMIELVQQGKVYGVTSNPSILRNQSDRAISMIYVCSPWPGQA